MTNILRVAAAAACVQLAVGTSTAHAQTNYFFQPDASEPEANRQWSDPSNWLEPELGNMFVPNFTFNERAIIDNGATAVLTVDSPDAGNDSVVTPGAVAIQSGGLDIRSTGALFPSAGNGAPGNVAVGGSGTATLLVHPGGRLEADGSFSVVGGADSTVTLGGSSGGTATLSANSMVLGGTLNVFPNAAVSSNGSISFQSSSQYRVEVTGSGSNGMLSAGGTASLGGALELNFTGFTPAGGDSWTILEANNISGGFSSVAANGLDLAFNETLLVNQADAGGGRRALNASIEEVLVLEVNRNTGAATIKHPGSSSITFDGYFVGSEGGLLSDNPAVWNSLNESGQYGSDWIETAQTTSNIAELKIGDDATFSGDIELGNVFDALAGEFGQDFEDLEFGYRRSSDGAEFPGIVQYVGDKVNSLLLQVDPSGTGDAFLRNTSETTVQVDAYEILSESGSLSTSGWSSLDAQGSTTNQWLEALNNSPNQLAEFDSEGFTTIAPGDSLNLGPLFTGSAEDLEFNFLMMGETEGTAGVVLYEAFTPSEGLPGDFNQDGTVDAADYTVWRDNLGGAGLPNDNDLGTVGGDHYNLWKSNFGSTAPASVSAATAAVPEPSAWCLAVLAVGIGLLRRHGN